MFVREDAGIRRLASLMHRLTPTALRQGVKAGKRSVSPASVTKDPHFDAFFRRRVPAAIFVDVVMVYLALSRELGPDRG